MGMPVSDTMGETYWHSMIAGLPFSMSPRYHPTYLAVAALLISALVHDTDHPGVMNTYLIATDHALATRRGKDKSAVLENHHAQISLSVLERAECDG